MRLETWAVLLSGFLLFAGYAPLEWKEAAWIGLVPLLIVLPGKTGRQAFWLGLGVGLVFWLLSVFWLVQVVWAGWILLSVYCAVYIGIFAWVVNRWFALLTVKTWTRNVLNMLVIMLAWTGLEFTRAHLFTGFPWNALAVTQYANIPLLQLVSVTGVSGLSALLVLGNAAVALTILRYIHAPDGIRRRAHPEFMLGLLCIALTFASGMRKVQRSSPEGEALRVGLVQPAIPQVTKWDGAHTDLIYSRLGELTRQAQAVGDLDVVIWPETALPDLVMYSEKSREFVYHLATNGTPILVGTIDQRYEEDGSVTYLNSSALFDQYGAPTQVYDKQELVMFGEYIPFDRYFPWVTALTPIQVSFKGGNTGTVFRVEEGGIPFSVLICFEDTMSELSRAAVMNGARVLVNQTNDAWFDPYCGSRQHLAQSVFRAVETGVPLVRCANTGISCVIGPHGRLLRELRDDEGRHLFPGFMTVDVSAAPDELVPTFYLRHGDWFGWTMCGGVALLMVFGWRNRRLGLRVDE